MPDALGGSEGWTSRDKHAAVTETASMNAVDLGNTVGGGASIPSSATSGAKPASGPTKRANDWERAATSRIPRETKDDKKRIKDLERDLAGCDLASKEKALAEAAALIILRRKAAAIWGRAGEDEWPHASSITFFGESIQNILRNGRASSQKRNVHFSAFA